MSAGYRRRRSIGVAATILFTAMASGAAAWWLSGMVRSPADVAAEAQPPPPSIITHPVELQVMTFSVVTRGTVARGETHEVKVLSAPGPDGAMPIVTAIVDPGHLLSEGDVVVEVAGRPVIALSGEFPMYRDLTVGDSGPDVLQLELALERLGFFSDIPDERFNISTRQAVRRLYESIGYLNPEGVAMTAEMLFLPVLPMQVLSNVVNVGELLSGDLVTLSGGDLHADLDLAVEVAAQLEEGLEVLIDDAISGIETTGVIESIAAPGTGGVALGRVLVRVALSSDVERLVGVSVRVRLPIESSSGPVLVVPAGAVMVNARGETVVEVVESSGTRTVIVETGLTGDGYIEVRPVSDQLEEGDLVSLGTGIGSQ